MASSRRQTSGKSLPSGKSGSPVSSLAPGPSSEPGHDENGWDQQYDHGEWDYYETSRGWHAIFQPKLRDGKSPT
jgi:hypothetical protein